MKKIISLTQTTYTYGSRREVKKECTGRAVAVAVAGVNFLARPERLPSRLCRTTIAVVGFG